jgi:hypothetical protein
MESSSNFALYLIGFLLLIGGVNYGAFLAGIPPIWIGAVVVALAGIGVMKTTQRSATPEDG